jgi:hypothetical protein
MPQPTASRPVSAPFQLARRLTHPRYAQAIGSRALGDGFADGMRALRQFIAERPDVPGTAEALGMLERDRSARPPQPGVPVAGGGQ